MTNHTPIRRRQRGSAMIEFTIAGIAGVVLLVSTVQLALTMWNYHTLAYAVHETNKYIASHGRSCATGGNACQIYVSDVANKLKTLAIGLSDSAMNMTLTSQSGITHTCNPVSTCESDGTLWPPLDHLDNNPGNSTQIDVNITLNRAILSMWYGTRGSNIGNVTLVSTSKIPINF